MDLSLDDLLREAGLPVPEKIANPEAVKRELTRLARRKDGSGWHAVYQEDRRRRGKRY